MHGAFDGHSVAERRRDLRVGLDGGAPGSAEAVANGQRRRTYEPPVPGLVYGEHDLDSPHSDGQSYSERL